MSDALQHDHQSNRRERNMKARHIIAAVAVALGLTACSTEADVASHNVSRAADQFEIERRIVFFNGITDKYLLLVEGRCSLGNNDPEYQLSVTCKVGPEEFKKHFLGLSDNVSYFVEQVDGAKVDRYHYRVIFRPESIVPDPDLKTSGRG